MAAVLTLAAYIPCIWIQIHIVFGSAMGSSDGKGTAIVLANGCLAVKKELWQPDGLPNIFTHERADDFMWWFGHDVVRFQSGRATIHFVRVPLWCAALMFGVPSLLLWRSAIRNRRAADPCPKCNYSLTGLPAGSACPECGGGKAAAG